MVMQVKRETWNLRGKRRHILVARVNGRLKSWTPLKGKTKQRKQLTAHFKQADTFNLKIVERTKFSTGTTRTTSPQRARPKRITQIGVHLNLQKVNKQGRPIGDPKDFEGYSKRGFSDEEGRKSARGNALKSATASDFAKYDNIKILSEVYFYVAWENASA